MKKGQKYFYYKFIYFLWQTYRKGGSSDIWLLNYLYTINADTDDNAYAYRNNNICKRVSLLCIIRTSIKPQIYIERERRWRESIFRKRYIHSLRKNEKREGKIESERVSLAPFYKTIRGRWRCWWWRWWWWRCWL